MNHSEKKETNINEMKRKNRSHFIEMARNGRAGKGTTQLNIYGQRISSDNPKKHPSSVHSATLALSFRGQSYKTEPGEKRIKSLSNKTQQKKERYRLTDKKFCFRIQGKRATTITSIIVDT